MNPAATEQPALSAAETGPAGRRAAARAARRAGLHQDAGHDARLPRRPQRGPDAVLAARLRAFALEAARAVLQEGPGTEPAAEPTTPDAVPEPAEEHWYGSSWWWDNPQVCLRVAVPVLAEMVGAGIVGADAGDADDLYWRGYSNQAHWDVRGAGFLVDVKRAWTDDADTIGFAGPQKPDDNDLYLYDQDKVHDILIVHLLDQDVSTTHGYEPDGTAFLTMRGTPGPPTGSPCPSSTRWSPPA
ncbi:hypothetical protein GXW82_43485 [Streptacidiphilus sp. 4-A2]|nr:hypothetical protein [Streptacidiphilus sp. 4-A2]